MPKVKPYSILRVCELMTCNKPFRTRDKRKRYCNPRHKNAAAQQRFRAARAKKHKRAKKG